MLLFIAIVALSVSIPSQAKADLVIDLSGDVGSSVVSWVASGSITIGDATPGLASNSTGRAPEGGTWDSLFDNNIGTIIAGGQSSDLNRALSSNISYRRNGGEFGEIEAFDIGADDDPGDDDFQIDMFGSVDYPVLSFGDIVSWVGSGTFTLSSSTYDSYFIGGSQGVSSLDGGNYVVNVAVATIPEPSSSGLACLGMCGWIARRRRS
jgi:hypothetical protein